MYTRMLVPLDGSDVAENVLPYARTLAKSLKIPVNLIGVIEISHYSARARAGYLDRLIDAAILRNQEYLQRVAKTFADASVEWTVEAGTPEEVIITKAAEKKGTLIAMATHGRSGLKRWLMGSIAEKVLRGAGNHLLLVRANEENSPASETTLNRIIVPLDGSRLAESVLPIAVELTKALNVKTILLRAYRVKHLLQREDEYTLDFKELEAELETQAASYLDAKVQQLKSEGLVDASPLASEGEAAETIIELAKGAPGSLIAMCSHGRSGVRRWVLGSVTEKVVRHASNPILVVRAQ